MVEQKTGIMTLGHKEPTVVKAMLEYLYKRDYVEVTDEPRDDESEPGVTQAPVPQVPSKEDKEKGKQVKSVQEPDGDVAESVDSLYEDVDDDPNGKELWNGPLTFNMRVYALATEYFIDDLKSFAIGKIKACINETSNDDFCKAVMVMHQDVPAEETELYDHIATAAAAHIVDLKGSASSEYLVKYHARVLLEVAVKAASVNGGVGRTSFLRISLVPKTPSWRCQFCTSIKHNRRCLSCHGIDRTEAWA